MLRQTSERPVANETANDQALIDFTCALVRLPSVLGDEALVAEQVSREMRRLLFDHVEIDADGNAVGVIRGLGDGPVVLLDAHMDTVDVLPADAWSRDPFGAEVADGRIYGRGSSDMKGALAAMVPTQRVCGRRPGTATQRPRTAVLTRSPTTLRSRSEVRVGGHCASDPLGRRAGSRSCDCWLVAATDARASNR